MAFYAGLEFDVGKLQKLGIWKKIIINTCFNVMCMASIRQ